MKRSTVIEMKRALIAVVVACTPGTAGATADPPTGGCVGKIQFNTEANYVEFYLGDPVRLLRLIIRRGVLGSTMESLFDDVQPRGRGILFPPFNATTAHVETKQIRLATTDEVCVVLESISHWPEGFTLNLALFLSTATKEIPHFLHHPLSTPPALDGPSLAVRFADGRKATTLDPLDHARDTGERVTLNVTSTVSGGETHLRQGIYVHPLPPPGPAVIAVRWPARVVGETRVELDGAEIRAGAARALRIWS